MIIPGCVILRRQSATFVAKGEKKAKLGEHQGPWSRPGLGGAGNRQDTKASFIWLFGGSPGGSGKKSTV